MSRKTNLCQKMMRAACRIAARDGTVIDALEAAAYLLEKERRQRGRLPYDDDSDWAAEYMITVYERASASIRALRPAAGSPGASPSPSSCASR